MESSLQSAESSSVKPCARCAGAAEPAHLQFFFVGLFSALFLYLDLFRWPLVPAWRWGDQSIFLLHAVRMLHGEVLYRDLFQFNLPGTETLYYLLFRLFGVHLVLVPLLLLITGTLMALVVLSLARRVLTGSAALIPPLLFVVVPLHNRLDGTHHWFSTALVLLAAWLLVDGCSMARLTAAGAVLALAGSFTSNRGLWAVAAVVIYLLWKHGTGRAFLRDSAAVVLPYAGLTAALLAGLAHHVGGALLYESTVDFPLHYFGANRSNNGLFAFWAELQSVLPLSHRSLPLLNLALCYALPFILLAFFAGPFRQRARELRASAAGRTLAFYALLGAALIASVTNSLSSIRLTCTVPFGVILAVWMLQPRVSAHGARNAIIAVLLLSVVELGYEHARKSGELSTPCGRISLLRVTYNDYTWLQQHTRPGECYFGDPDIAFVLGLTNPTAYPWINASAYTRPQHVVRILAQLESHQARYVGYAPDMRPSGAADDNLGPLRTYLEQHYHEVFQLADGTVILERVH